MLIIHQMLKKYELHTIDDHMHAMKEVIQEIVLSGLSRTNFFTRAAFYGGTALRIFHGLNRFSDVLDFSLLAIDPNFRFEPLFSTLKNEMGSLGLDIGIKVKTAQTQIESAIVTGNMKKLFQTFYPNSVEYHTGLHAHEKIRVKIEVDTRPPEHATTELKYRLLPAPYQVRLYDLSSLFAGKIDAVLRRGWKTRVKGRDFYDYVFFLSKETPVNIAHLKARLIGSGFIDPDFDLNKESLIDLLDRRFGDVDFEEAEKDVLPIIRDTARVNLWSEAFFKDITKQLKTT